MRVCGVAVLALVAAALAPKGTRAQGRPGEGLPLTTGKEIYRAACVGCHGPDGKGQPQVVLGFELPDTFPDFSDCPTTTPESDMHWRSIITGGGLQRGFSEIMPAFGEALTQDQIGLVVDYLRTLCTDESWPRAEMNLPRPLYTEKAFPENETVITSTAGLQGSTYSGGSLIYEKRFGARTNLEFVAPYLFNQPVNGSTDWSGGIGDLTIEFKRVAFYSLRRGTLLTAASEFNFPTGDRSRGMGNGVTIVEPYVSFAQLLPRESFFQAQTGVEFPTRSGVRPREAFLRTAIGKTLRQMQGLERAWTPMVEFIVARRLADGARTEFDVAPQFQVTLAQRQHIRLNVGVRIPVNNFNNRSVELGSYLLWDWFDGGFRDGWRGPRE